MSIPLIILQEAKIIPIIPAYSINLMRKDPIPRKRKQFLNTIIQQPIYKLTINSVISLQNHLKNHKSTSNKIHKFRSLVTSSQVIIKRLTLKTTWKNTNQNINQHKNYKPGSLFRPHIFLTGLKIQNCFLIKINLRITSLPLRSLFNSKPSKSLQEIKNIKQKASINPTTPKWGITKSTRPSVKSRKISRPRISKITIRTQNNRINSFRLTFNNYWKTLMLKILKFMKRSQESPSLTSKSISDSTKC